MSKDFYNTWQSFAEAASVEHDSAKLAHLVEQLNHALEAEERKTRFPPMTAASANQTNSWESTI
jgi:hypothetical protein